jgi:hypothetical protein
MNSKRAAAVSLSVVLFLGLLIGIVIDRFLIDDLFRPPVDGRHRPDFFADLTKELQLDPQQQEQLKTLLEEVKTKHEALRKTMGPQFRSVREEFQGKFAQILSAEQKLKFDQFNKKEPPKDPTHEPRPGNDHRGDSIK